MIEDIFTYIIHFKLHNTYYLHLIYIIYIQMEYYIPQGQMHKIHHIKPKFSMPDFDREDFLPPMPHMPRMPHMPPMPSMPEMPSIPAMPSMPDMPSIPAMPPLTHDLIRAHVAGDNEKYSGSSYSSHSHSTIINGKETFEGSVSSLINDGHHVEEKIMEYGN
ncbi:seroin isoform X1 [Manduca sexta]|uniref:seroin isoform X1 n=1 Tax=Manduca sexta TaxID=7130 RepID=UPI00188E693C|nr:seroin isoform X1 [Manduca sexta]